jgi:hypothetical protein
MKKTSRRDFAKTMTAALAAAPVALSTSAAAKAQTPGRPAQTPISPQRILNHQNTPPDLILEQGSLKIDVKDPSLENESELPPASGGHQWQFPQTGTPRNIYMTGLQIVSGAGQLLFYVDRDHVDDAEKLHELSVLVHMEGTPSNRQEVVVSTAGRFVTFKMPNNRKLKKNHQNNVPIPDPGSPGRVRFRYLDQNGNAGNFNVQSIAVALGPHGQHKVITRVDIDHLQQAGPGTQVLAWFKTL